MDLYELGRSLTGNARLEEGLTKTPNSVSGIFGVAETDSIDGKVTVYIDGVSTECDTGPDVLAGQEVLISVIGTRPVVTNVVGYGDYTKDKLSNLQDEITPVFILESNTSIVYAYPSSIYVPANLIVNAFERVGIHEKIPYVGRIVVSISNENLPWQDIIDEDDVSSVSIQLASIASSFSTIRVVVYSHENSSIDLGSIIFNVIESEEEYVTHNSAGTWFHQLAGPENYQTNSYVHLFSQGMEIGENGVVNLKIDNNEIDIGINSTDSTISFCGGLATMSFDSYENVLDLETTTSDIHVAASRDVAGDGGVRYQAVGGLYGVVENADTVNSTGVAILKGLGGVQHGDNDYVGSEARIEVKGSNAGASIFMGNESASRPVILTASTYRFDIKTINNDALFYINGKEFWEWIYPIGTVYISYASTSPASLFGGSWVAIIGRFPYFNESTSTGGANTKSITVENLPAHSHDVVGLTSILGGGGSQLANLGAGSGWTYVANNSISSVGSGTAFNVLPAYQMLYAWRRMA